ncbi:hypothetical protein IT575_09690 [bacterium]|nr:hypothetical protein [bacterium]
MRTEIFKLTAIWGMLGFIVAMVGCPSRESPSVIGSTNFKTKVDAALKELKENTPEAYSVVQQYLGRIEEGFPSRVLAHTTPTVAYVSGEVANHSTVWLAGGIAHEAYHCKLYIDYKSLHGVPVPESVFAQREAEQRCNAFQLEVLRALNAPESEIKYMESQDGTHGDLNGDGWSDDKDRKLQDW